MTRGLDFPTPKSRVKNEISPRQVRTPLTEAPTWGPLWGPYIGSATTCHDMYKKYFSKPSHLKTIYKVLEHRKTDKTKQKIGILNMFCKISIFP